MFSPSAILSSTTNFAPPSPLDSAFAEFWSDYSRQRKEQQKTNGINSLSWAISSERAARYARERVARLTMEERRMRDQRLAAAAAETDRMRAEEEAKVLAAIKAAEARRVAEREEELIRKAKIEREREEARLLVEEAAVAIALAARMREEENKEKEKALARVMAQDTILKAELAARKLADDESKATANDSIFNVSRNSEADGKNVRASPCESTHIVGVDSHYATEAKILPTETVIIQKNSDDLSIWKPSSMSEEVLDKMCSSTDTDNAPIQIDANTEVSTFPADTEKISLNHILDEKSALLRNESDWKKTSMSSPCLMSSLSPSIPTTSRSSSNIFTPDKEIVSRSPVYVRVPSEMFEYDINEICLPLKLERSITPPPLLLNSEHPI